MRRILPCLVLTLLLGTLFVACSSNSSNRRVVNVVQTDDGCTPAAVPVTAGEKIKLQVRNDGKKDHELEGIEGAKLEELLVPAGRSRSTTYAVPKANGNGTYKLNCYIPGGSSTTIVLSAGGS